MSEWAHVRAGSIYGALRSLEKDEYIISETPTQESNYPAKTHYTVSETGKVELLRAVRSTLWDASLFDSRSAFIVASFMFVLTREEVLAGLHGRVSKVERIIAENQFNIAETVGSETTPAYVREILELAERRVNAEREWALALIERIQAGEYQFSDTGS